MRDAHEARIVGGDHPLKLKPTDGRGGEKGVPPKSQLDFASILLHRRLEPLIVAGGPTANVDEHAVLLASDVRESSFELVETGVDVGESFERNLGAPKKDEFANRVHIEQVVLVTRGRLECGADSPTARRAARRGIGWRVGRGGVSVQPRWFAA